MLARVLAASLLIASSAAAEPRLAPPGPSHGAGQRFVDAAPLELAPRSETRAVVLLYHAFDVGPDPLGLSSRRFEAHLDWLGKSGVTVVPLSALIDFLEGRRKLPARVAVITIDDAHRSVHRKAFPLLSSRQLPFTLGIPTAYVEKPRQPTLSWAEIREMVGSGLCELASHGHRHRRLGVLEPRDAHDELELSRRIIERETGVRPIAYFYPLGAHEGPAPARVRAAGYRAAFTATGGAIAYDAFSRFVVPRTTVQHGDSTRRVSWLFSREFLERLPPGFTASSSTR